MGPTEWALVLVAGLLALCIVALCLTVRWACNIVTVYANNTSEACETAQSQALMFSSNELARLNIEVEAKRAEHASGEPVPKPRTVIVPPPDDTEPMDPSTWKVT